MPPQTQKRRQRHPSAFLPHDQPTKKDYEEFVATANQIPEDFCALLKSFYECLTSTPTFTTNNNPIVVLEDVARSLQRRCQPVALFCFYKPKLVGLPAVLRFSLNNGLAGRAEVALASIFATRHGMDVSDVILDRIDAMPSAADAQAAADGVLCTRMLTDTDRSAPRFKSAIDDACSSIIESMETLANIYQGRRMDFNSSYDLDFLFYFRGQHNQKSDLLRVSRVFTFTTTVRSSEERFKQKTLQDGPRKRTLSLDEAIERLASSTSPRPTAPAGADAPMEAEGSHPAAHAAPASLEPALGPPGDAALTVTTNLVPMEEGNMPAAAALVDDAPAVAAAAAVAHSTAAATVVLAPAPASTNAATATATATATVPTVHATASVTATAAHAPAPATSSAAAAPATAPAAAAATAPAAAAATPSAAVAAHLDPRRAAGDTGDAFQSRVTRHHRHIQQARVAAANAPPPVAAPGPQPHPNEIALQQAHAQQHARRQEQLRRLIEALGLAGTRVPLSEWGAALDALLDHLDESTLVVDCPVAAGSKFANSLLWIRLPFLDRRSQLKRGWLSSVNTQSFSFTPRNLVWLHHWAVTKKCFTVSEFLQEALQNNVDAVNQMQGIPVPGTQHWASLKRASAAHGAASDRRAKRARTQQASLAALQEHPEHRGGFEDDYYDALGVGDPDIGEQTQGPALVAEEPETSGGDGGEDGAENDGVDIAAEPLWAGDSEAIRAPNPAQQYDHIVRRTAMSERVDLFIIKYTHPDGLDRMGLLQQALVFLPDIQYNEDGTIAVSTRRIVVTSLADADEDCRCTCAHHTETRGPASPPCVHINFALSFRLLQCNYQSGSPFRAVQARMEDLKKIFDHIMGQNPTLDAKKVDNEAMKELRMRCGSSYISMAYQRRLARASTPLSFEVWCCADAAEYVRPQTCTAHSVVAHYEIPAAQLSAAALDGAPPPHSISDFRVACQHELCPSSGCRHVAWFIKHASSELRLAMAEKAAALAKKQAQSPPTPAPPAFDTAEGRWRHPSETLRIADRFQLGGVSVTALTDPTCINSYYQAQTKIALRCCCAVQFFHQNPAQAITTKDGALLIGRGRDFGNPHESLDALAKMFCPADTATCVCQRGASRPAAPESQDAEDQSQPPPSEAPCWSEPEYDRNVTLYTKEAKLSVPFWSRYCLRCRAKLDFSGLELGVHVHTTQTAFLHGVLWDYLSGATSHGISHDFRGYCEQKTNAYRAMHGRLDATFVCVNVLVKAVFGFLSTLGDVRDGQWRYLDFRDDRCKPGECQDMVAADATCQVLIPFSALDPRVFRAARQELGSELRERNTNRFTRAVCPPPEPAGEASQSQKQYIAELEALPRRGRITTLQKCQEPLSAQQLNRENLVYNLLPGALAAAFAEALGLLQVGSIPNWESRDYRAGAWLRLCRECTLTSSIQQLIPDDAAKLIQQYLEAPADGAPVPPQHGPEIEAKLRYLSPPLYAAMVLYVRDGGSAMPSAFRNLLAFLVARQSEVRTQLQHDSQKPSVFDPKLNSYDPPGQAAALYFEEHGCVGRPRTYDKWLDEKDPSASPAAAAAAAVNGVTLSNHDDSPTAPEACNKEYARSKTHSYVMFFFCPQRGTCLGFHVIDGCEGRKDVYQVLMRYKREAPKTIFYDFGCSLQEYCSNRCGGHFADTLFFHDLFHGVAHKCSDAFRFSDRGGPRVNTSICEQFNSFIARFKQLSLHLTWERSCHLLQFFIWKWNRDKERSRDIACGRRFGAAAAAAAAAAPAAPAAAAEADIDA